MQKQEIIKKHTVCLCNFCNCVAKNTSTVTAFSGKKEKINTSDLIMTSLSAQFVDIHFPDRHTDHDIISETFIIVIPH